MPTDTTTTHTLNRPETATKAPRVLKKRGRKGNKIDTAFREVPREPVNFEEYAATHGVKTTVLRQIKRHDKYADVNGKVFVRKNKETKTMMIWRERLDD